MLHDIKINETNALTVLKPLDINKAAGIDNISPKVLMIRYCPLSLLNQSAIH